MGQMGQIYLYLPRSKPGQFADAGAKENPGAGNRMTSLWVKTYPAYGDTIVFNWRWTLIWATISASCEACGLVSPLCQQGCLDMVAHAHQGPWQSTWKVWITRETFSFRKQPRKYSVQPKRISHPQRGTLKSVPIYPTFHWRKTPDYLSRRESRGRDKIRA